jgi:hypothetical protein
VHDAGDDLVRVVVTINRRDFDVTLSHLQRLGLDVRRKMKAWGAVSGYIDRRRVWKLPKVPGVTDVQLGSGRAPRLPREPDMTADAKD